MKTKKTILTLFATLGFLTLIIAGCSNPSAIMPAERTEAETPSPEISLTLEIPTTDSNLVPMSTSELPDSDADRAVELDPTPQSVVDTPPSASGLTAAEIANLQFMREEEKLAHDVYVALYEMWGLNIFQNISRAEQTHTEAVQTLLDTYGLEDPALGKDPGVFNDHSLQALYDQLVAEGSHSLADALLVGGAIEELDILDLERSIAQTDQADIQLVYENLLKGSRNHLRSFAATYERQVGEAYMPQYMETDAYLAIVGTEIERGAAGGGNGRGRRGGNN